MDKKEVPMEPPVLIKLEARMSIFGQRFMRRKSSVRLKKVITHICDFPADYDSPYIPRCGFCSLDFMSLYDWQAHFIIFIHKKPCPTPAQLRLHREETLIVCKACHQDVIVQLAKEHRCFLAETERLKNIVIAYNITYVPIICVLCKSIMTFQSQAHLQIHLLTRHSPTRDPLRCNICDVAFKTTNVNVIEDHAIDVHGPELNLIYWRLIGEQNLVRTKTEDIKYICALSHFSNIYNEKIVTCEELMTDLFQLILHTLCCHGFLHRKIREYQRTVERKLSNYQESEIFSCKYCGENLENKHSFADHILSTHIHDIMIRKEYILRKELLSKNVPTSHTCITCLSIFPNIIDLQMHIMVNHGTEQFGLCGMCGEDLLHFQDGKNTNRIDRIHWKTIKYHEMLHLNQHNNFKETGTFNQSLKIHPKLYISDQEFADELENRKNIKPLPTFTDEQIAFFKVLGQSNYATQVNIEMNDQ